MPVSYTHLDVYKRQGALCDAWKKRLGETAVALRFGRPENQEKNRAEHERVQSIISHSTCTH